MASSKARTATVTIHRGELAQIRSHINHRDSRKPAKGQLYGLWTHSFQPVIQLVVDLPESSKSSAKNQEYNKLLSDNYGLCLLGEWLGAEKGSATYVKAVLPEFQSQKRYVNIMFGLEDKGLSVMKSVVKRGEDQYDEEGKLEILPGQSSFRLCENLIKDPRINHSRAIDVSEEDRAAESGEVREAEVKENQWYSTENGMEILKWLFQILPTTFEVLETSRNTETHNIGFSLKYRMQGRGHSYSREVNLRLEFPANFPQSEITLFCEDQKLQVPIVHDSEQQPEEFSQIICASVMSKMDQHFKPRPEKAGRQRADESRTNTANWQRGKSRDTEEIEKKANDKEEEKIHQEYTQDDEKQTENHDSVETPMDVGDQPTSEGSTQKTDDSSQIGETEGEGRSSVDIEGRNSVPASGNADGHKTEPPVGHSADAPPQGGSTDMDTSV